MSPSASRLGDVQAVPVTWPSHAAAGQSRNGHDADARWLVELDEPAPRHSAADRAADHDKQIYARAYADGQHAAMAAAEQQSQEQARRLATAVAAIAHLRQTVMQRAERDVVRLALAMASRIAHREIRQDPAQIAAIARDAIARLGDRVEAIVRLHPRDLEAVRAAALGEGEPTTIQIVADPRLDPGSCVVESPAGTVDASIDTQLREIAAKMFDQAEGAANADAPDA